MMRADDYVRVLILAGSVLLFYGSYRSQKWVKIQADREERAAKDRAALAPINPAPPQREATRIAAPGEFNQVGAEVLSRPLFDRKAYILLCVGFGIATLASLIDIVEHTTRGHRFFEHLLAL